SAAAAPPEIHFDLNLDLIVNRLLKETQAKEKEKRETPKTPTERILERIILREREIRTVNQDTRRVVIESGGQRTAANLPADKKSPAQTGAQTKQTKQTKQTVRVRVRESRQAGEGRSAGKPDAPRRSAALTPPSAAERPAEPAAGRKLPHKTLTLASQVMSAPAAGGWTPQEREPKNIPVPVRRWL
ncbi:MAG: hypothetical protein IKN25_02420, partial [Spirochaetales bacterium]|nr:hypothetical protein [Spirochaetales bacterium]